jgi:hypothetical protein
MTAAIDIRGKSSPIFSLYAEFMDCEARTAICIGDFVVCFAVPTKSCALVTFSAVLLGHAVA